MIKLFENNNEIEDSRIDSNLENPDREIEEFWLTFKDSSSEFLTQEQKYEMDELSDKLNNFKRLKQYYQIESYIKNHLEIVGFRILEQNNYYRANHLITNIKRWIKITDKLTWDNKSCNKISDLNNVFYCLLSIYIGIHKKKIPAEGYRKEILDLIIQYSRTKDDKIINELVNISIKNNIDGYIEKLRHIVDIEMYLKQGYDEKILNMKGRKLLRFLEPKYLFINN